jgi:hypothetical protein
MSDAITYDDDCWPILIVTLPARPVGDEVLRRHLGRMAVFHERGAFVQILDAREHPPLVGRQRQLVAESLIDHTRRWPGRLLGRAMDTSERKHGTVEALDWLTRQPWPRASFDDVDAAFAWALELVHDQARGEAAPALRVQA